ncbi:MAG TPA: RluA family pseudouridine synthase [Terriglobia bacterium]|nr:RluA family pseudouridine synthase [Terriglobia bacterium]
MILRVGPEDRGQRLDIFLARNLVQFTRSHIQTLNRAGAVRIGERQEKAGYRLRGDEVIEIDLGDSRQPALEPREIPLQVVYEDEDLAVLEKPAGLVVHPGAGTREATLVQGLMFRFQKLSGAGGASRPGIVHRIDKWTSGLLIIAKNDWAHARLSRAFQDRAVEKTYLALVHGRLKEASGEVALNISRHSTVRTRMSARVGRGRVALSSWRKLKEIGDFSLLEVKIKTGRTHQIRVHLAAIGHPVVGDDVYGERRYAVFARKYGKPGRYFLHASELKFTHPRTGQTLQFRSPLPEELSSLLEQVGK